MALGQIGDRGPLEDVLDRPRHVAPEALQAAPGVGEARVVRGFEAEHRVELAFDRVRDLGHRDFGGIAGEAAPATRAPEALDQARLVQGAQLLLKESRGDLLHLGDLPGGDEPAALPAHRQLDHRPHGVLELLRDLQHGLRTLQGNLGTGFVTVNEGCPGPQRVPRTGGPEMTRSGHFLGGALGRYKRGSRETYGDPRCECW